jgi:hypothetical protein
MDVNCRLLGMRCGVFEVGMGIGRESREKCKVAS